MTARRLDRFLRLRQAVCAFLVLLLSAELSLRVILAVRDQPYDGRTALADCERALATVLDVDPKEDEPIQQPSSPAAQQQQAGEESHYILSPFSGWLGDRSITDLELLPQEAADTSDQLRVLIVGGSVSAKFRHRGQERLGELIAEHSPQLRVEFFNFGQGGHKQPQQLGVVALIFGLGFVPDVVVNIDGFNEIAGSMSSAGSGVHPCYPWIQIWRPLAQDLSTLTPLRFRLLAKVFLEQDRARGMLGSVNRFRPFFGSAVIGVAMRARALGIHDRWATNLQAYASSGAETLDRTITGPAFSGDESRAFESIVEMWTESSITLDAMCKRRGIAYLHVLQPTLTDPDSKPLTQEEQAIVESARSGESTFVEVGYPLLRTAGDRLREEGIRFLDATRIFTDVQDRVYGDVCHYNKRGNTMLAEHIAGPLLDAIGR